MIEVGKNSKITIHWKVSPYDYSKQKEKEIITKVSKKYKIPKEHVRVVPDFQLLKEDGTEFSITADVINNIQDEEFQLKLCKDYIELHKITDINFDIIRKIDSDINAKIDYQVYDKYKRYSIKWIKWDNFLSYGTDNYFDFTNLNHLVLLNGEPANQSGKTTFAIDLLHFLLFGKTTKVPTQDKIFNKHLPEATQVVVEGCLNIDGSDYIIKRTLSRPALDKRTSRSKTTQKVEYYKIVGGSQEELEEYIDNQQEENSVQTNKVIKEAIGKESDFDLILSITESNLDDLIEKKESERGKLLSRWIGLLPLEEKDIIAREKFNSEIKPYLISNHMNIEELKQDNEHNLLEIKAFEEQNERLKQEISSIDKDIVLLEKQKGALLSAKQVMDENLLKVDITTLDATIEKIKRNGQNEAFKLNNINTELGAMGTISFSVEEFDKVTDELNAKKEKRAVMLTEYKSVQKNIENLSKSEYCPTCGRKLEGVDHSEQIQKFTQLLNTIKENGTVLATDIKQLEEKVLSLKDSRDKYTKYSALIMQKSAIELNIAKLRNDYREKALVKKEYEQNKSIIDRNNKIDIELRNSEISLNGKRQARDNDIRLITSNNNQISERQTRNKSNDNYIAKIQEEQIMLRHWKVYLEMIGRDGISKMVLRKTLPIINARLAQMLSDICDFDVEIKINDKNDVMFYLIKDGVISDLSSGSGFEKTASALALRAVLSDISTLPKLNGMIMDELWGRVAKENFDNIQKLLEKILTEYDWIIIISHLDEIKDWCQQCITVKKEDNISKLSVAKKNV